MPLSVILPITVDSAGYMSVSNGPPLKLIKTVNANGTTTFETYVKDGITTRLHERSTHATPA